MPHASFGEVAVEGKFPVKDLLLIKICQVSREYIKRKLLSYGRDLLKIFRIKNKYYEYE